MSASGVTGISGVSGVERIAEAFARSRADGRAAALMPYMMGGFPDLETSRRIGEAYIEAGADLIELGVPFSDPLADGPVIHAAATTALAAGVTLPDVMTLGAELGRRVPVILMCYVNPILARGVERFADELAAAGICGLIVPDVPLEEARELWAACSAHELAWVPLVAPTSSPERMAAIGGAARGFLYVVGVTGTTGERDASDGGASGLLARARAVTDVPLALGFGISTPEQAAAAAAAGADGVIVGSRLVRAAGAADGGPEAVAGLVRDLSAALTTG
ncbi:MAG TPA: tryptophan synthase subunit alpha [Solirubrobacteraceae bacterium]|nr:tryptophan synthase subunit alpha [Solirubrobacteraceae bacterium]